MRHKLSCTTVDVLQHSSCLTNTQYQGILWQCTLGLQKELSSQIQIPTQTFSAASKYGVHPYQCIWGLQQGVALQAGYSSRIVNRHQRLLVPSTHRFTPRMATLRTAYNLEYPCDCGTSAVLQVCSHPLEIIVFRFSSLSSVATL